MEEGLALSGVRVSQVDDSDESPRDATSAQHAVELRVFEPRVWTDSAVGRDLRPDVGVFVPASR